MRVDLMIEGQEGVTWSEWTAIAGAAEAGTFGALFRSDHHVSLTDPGRRGSLDAWATVSALAAVTETIRLGTNVSPVLFRHPAELARLVATADHISGGRIELGMGAGWFAAEHESFGFGFPDAVERFDILEEQLEIVHRLLSEEEPVSFSGAHYALNDAVLLPRPVQRPRPPLLLGGVAGRRAARLAARWADEYNLYGVTPGEARRRVDALRAACTDAGRDPGSLVVSLVIPVFLGDDAGRAAIARFLEQQPRGSDPDAYLADHGERSLIGTPGHVLARMGEYAAAGVGRIRLQHFSHTDIDAVVMMGEQIVPGAAEL